MRSFGVDVSDHRSRHLEPDTMVNVDLVIGMERKHVREAVVLRPEAWPRSFTLRELVRRGDAIGPRRHSETLQAWLARAHLGRSPDAYLSEDCGHDDIADPVGLPNDANAETAIELEGLIERLVDLGRPSQKS
jgi:protein-tyrosine phosphatase